jgi:hypothetical protein
MFGTAGCIGWWEVPPIIVKGGTHGQPRRENHIGIAPQDGTPVPRIKDHRVAGDYLGTMNPSSITMGCVLLLIVSPVAAQSPIFRGDFEWGDTSDWSTSEPPRCDRVGAFGRGLRPASSIP